MPKKKEPVKIDHAQRPHAPFGGSVAARRINCPGSYFLESQLPKQISSAQADEGTLAHECVEWGLADFLYRKIHGEGIDIPKPLFFSEFEEYVDGYVKDVWEKALECSITGKSYAIEKVVTISEGLGMYGPADFACVYPDERGRSCGIIGDYKHGYTFVDAHKNDQLAHYACGLREEVRRAGKDLEYVRAFIYQPRVGATAYRDTLFTGKFLDTWKKRAFKAAEQIFIKKKPKFKAGSWCGWCAGKSVCAAYIKQRTVETQLELVDHTVIELPKVEMMPPEQVAKIVLHSDKLEAFIKSCHDYAFDRYMSGNGLPGLKIVEGSGKRSWNKNTEDILITLRGKGIKNPEKASLRPLTEIEKELKKSLKEKDAEELMATLTTKSSPKVLVEESDPRPAVASNKSLLDVIEEQNVI